MQLKEMSGKGAAVIVIDGGKDFNAAEEKTMARYVARRPC